MNESTSSSGVDDPFDAAAQRLERALGALESRFKALQRRAASAEGEAEASRASDEDRSRLADELDAARAREAALSEAAGEASSALDEAIAELRRTLGRDGTDQGESG